MKYLNKYFIVLITAHIIVFSLHYIIFEAQLVIESHFDNQLLLVIFGLLLLIFCLISFSLSKILKQPISKIISKGLIGILLSLFSINLFSLIKLVNSLLHYQDILFTNKFLTIRYIYTKKQLIFFIQEYYKKISNNVTDLNVQTLHYILKDAKTIDEVMLNVETYVNYERTAWWPQIKQFFSATLSWGYENPVLLTSGIAILIGIISYPVYKLIINQSNSFSVYSRDLAQNVKNNTDRLDYLELACRNIISAISKMNLTNKEVIRILHAYMGVESQIALTLNMDEEKIFNLRTHILSFTESLKKLYLEIVKTPSIEDRIVFHGEGHRLGGESTSSRLLNLND